MINIKLVPELSKFDNEESGIKRVVEAYIRYGGEYGLNFIEHENYDVMAVHAGTTSRFNPEKPLVSHIHGLYWTADYPASQWEQRANSNVIASLRYATEITVPSRWVAETLQRDMHVNPHVLPHGIDWQDWQHDYDHSNYVLWNKNRSADVCDPRPVIKLAEIFPQMPFVTTFVPYKTIPPRNVTEIGLKPHDEMKRIVQQALIYLSTTKETFGIGTLEALASGVPVLGFAYGGNLEIVEHGVNGYLAAPGNYEDLADGLDYCVKYHEILSTNTRETVRKFTWSRVMEYLEVIYKDAIEKFYDMERPFVIDESLYIK